MSVSAQIQEYDSSSVEWVGPHSAISLSKVLKRVAHEEKSGDLQVAFGKSTKTIYVKDGRVVFAASSIADDRLGETMLERGSISEYEFLLASSLMKTEGRKFGESLVRIGLITPEELKRQLGYQFNHIVQSLFRVREGIYSFEERLSSIPNDLMVDLAVPYLLLDGLRSVRDDSLLFSCLPFPKSCLHATTRAFADFDVSMLTPEELAVLRVAREGADLTTIISEVGGDPHNILRLCSALSVLGFLELEMEQDGHIDLDKKITAMFDQTERMTESQVLEVNPGADRGVIERAYTLKRLEWTQLFELVKGRPEFEYQVLEIQFRLAAAYHRLLLDGHPRPDRKVLHDRDHSQVTGTEVSDSQSAEGAGKSDPSASKMTNTSTEKQLLNAVKAHFKAKDWDAAIPLLFKLVEMAPRHAAYRGFLAKAMFKHPLLRKNAESHFLEAIQLTPLDPKLHMWLGLYYKASGQALRAATAFRTALELDPDNPVAKKYFLAGESAGQIVC